MKCKICHSPVYRIFERKILNKHLSGYHQCANCGFVQTDEPVWLEEAYANAITSLDIGLVERNMVLRDECIELIDACYPTAARFLDYAGGYGLFVRMMRDKGFDFYRQDIYCENLFANYFDISDTPEKHFDMVTAFEVFEHFADPMAEIEKIVSFSDTLVFSTKLLPADTKEIANWWYLSTETGQHIAFYEQRTLEFIARKFDKRYYFNGKNLHVLTGKAIPDDRIEFVRNGKAVKKRFFGLIKSPVTYKVERQSLLESDYKYIQGILRAGGEK